MSTYNIVKINKLSGSECSIYTIESDNTETKTFLDRFIDENINSFKSETLDLIKRLHTIGHKTGARLQYFKINEGVPGDGVCALYDAEESNLRLYCIHYGKQLIIVGGGGHKPKSIRTFQEDEKLKRENYFLRRLSKMITERIKDKEIEYSDDDMDFDGNLTFDFDN
jgi:hypothetical protein